MDRTLRDTELIAALAGLGRQPAQPWLQEAPQTAARDAAGVEPQADLPGVQDHPSQSAKCGETAAAQMRARTTLGVAAARHRLVCRFRVRCAGLRSTRPHLQLVDDFNRERCISRSIPRSPRSGWCASSSSCKARGPYTKLASPSKMPMSSASIASSAKNYWTSICSCASRTHGFGHEIRLRSTALLTRMVGHGNLGEPCETVFHIIL